MANHKVYSAIVRAVKSGQLKGPFGQGDFRRACPGLGEGTHKAFLHKHRKGNPGGAAMVEPSRDIEALHRRILTIIREWSSR